jgi:hypothetical protein
VEGPGPIYGRSGEIIQYHDGIRECLATTFPSPEITDLAPWEALQQPRKREKNDELKNLFAATWLRQRQVICLPEIPTPVKLFR